MTEGFLSLPYLQWVWLGHLFLVVPSLLMCLVLGHSWDVSSRLPTTVAGGVDAPTLRFWQFRKKLHWVYLTGILWTGWIMWNFESLCFGGEKSERLTNMLDTLTKPERQSTGSFDTFLAGLLYFLFLMKRLYESSRVSIHSYRQVLNPIDLLLLYAYYLAVGLSLVSEASGFSQDSCFEMSLSWRHPVAILLYIWASFQQLSSFHVLAKLRRNRAGHIVTTGYKIPKQGLFAYCTVPHYFCEILIHISIGLILGFSNFTWWLMTSYVVFNMIFLGYNTHAWYQKKFDDYPKDRKIIIPYIL